ncbi:MAG: polyphosphate polymerase domain-containing protein [Ruminococcus sp.]|nr:polyphosphate polymerase domain-containing protein [Ruminococcus sp.]
MKFRHEWKHEINYSDMLVLRHRLKAVARCDPNAPNGRYFIRSLYFDTPYDKALKEKINGISRREKFRIRYYNGDTSFIRLEKKSKLDGLCSKEEASLTADEAQSIICGDIDFMRTSENELVRELYDKMNSQQLRPKTIVDYDREAYVYPAGNVRVTMDCNIRTGLYSTDFLDMNCVTVPVTGAVILEVKWDEFLPSTIRDAVQLEGRHTSSFSKYAACRIYG